MRFLAHDHGAREVKDALARDVLPLLEAVGIGIASTSLEITGLAAGSGIAFKANPSPAAASPAGTR